MFNYTKLNSIRVLATAVLVLLVSAVLASRVSNALEPEDILGEYWKDPLFGVAAAEQSVSFEVLYKLLFSPNTNIQTGKKTRIVFENKTDQVHVFVFTKDLSVLSLDDAFSLLVNDEVHHASMATRQSAGGHEHSSTNTDDAKAIVRTLDQNPIVTIAPDEYKEIIIRFVEPGQITVTCAVAGHEELEHKNTLVVTESVMDAMQLNEE